MLEILLEAVPGQHELDREPSLGSASSDAAGLPLERQTDGRISASRPPHLIQFAIKFLW
jgi:hypothetical protein